MPVTMFTNNTEGMNLTDSPLVVKDTQATGQSYNYDYGITGAITKVLGSSALNTADSQLTSLGLGIHHSASTDARTVIRCAGTKIQTFTPDTGAISNIAEDTLAAGTDFLSSSSTQPVVSAPFNTTDGGTQLWLAGGGMNSIYGYTGTNITSNGTPIPTGSVTPTVNTAAGGSFASSGTYKYAVAFRKLGTQTISNAALDFSATLANTTDTVTVPLTGLSNTDSTKYDKIYLYRSAVSGSTSFTTGDLVAIIASSATTYTDTGTSTTSSTNVPRAGNSTLDNSVLPSGTVKYITVFKRRLVALIGSTLYVSDLNKPESWPTANRIVIPSGGPGTALGVIGTPSEFSTGADEYLCAWKEDELWVLTGSSASDWALLFVDKTGCLGQSMVVPFNGLVAWLAFNGIYVWSGKGKPTRISRPIQAMFGADGDLDKTVLYKAVGKHYKKANQVVWRVSHRIKGEQKLSIKLDTRLMAKALGQSSEFQNPEVDGVFILDFDGNAYYAMTSYVPMNGEEDLLVGDDAGYVYKAYGAAATAVSFDYETRPLDMGLPQNNKKFLRVLVFVEKLTPNDLSLFYWVDHRVRSEYKSVVKASLAPAKGTQPALWDVALWDQAYWDDYTPDISPIEFQLHATENNAEGSCIKLRFEQTEASAPVRIHGFAVEWEDNGPISIPTQQVA